MSKITSDMTFKSIGDWEKRLFPQKSSAAQNSGREESPIQMAVTLANKSIKNLKKHKSV